MRHEPVKTKLASCLLAATISAHFLLGLVYDWATPILEASDEGLHYGVVHWLALGNPLPVQDPDNPNPLWAQEGSQPPLYYLLAAKLAALVDRSDSDHVTVHNPMSQAGIPGTTHNANMYRHLMEAAPLAGTHLAVKLARLFSLLLSCLTIYLTALVGRRLFPDNEPLALLAAAIVAFNPMALFINASVNNDNLLMLLSAATLLVTLQFMQPTVSHYPARALGLGLLVGLAALTKLSGLVLWPVAALGVAWGAWRGRDVRRFIVCGLLIAGAALGVSGWWFWRNHQLYGELLGLKTMAMIAGPRQPAITVFQLIRSEAQGFWLSYWGVFGGFNILPARWVFWFFDALTIWALAGGIWAAATRKRLPPRLPEFLVAGLFVALTLVGLTQWTLQTHASQGRLMFGAIAPLSIAMAAGIVLPFKPHWRSRVAVAVAGALVLIAMIVPVLYIAPHYAPPPSISESELPADLQPVHAIIAGEFELIGYTFDDAVRTPGETQTVTLYWRALAPMTKDYALVLCSFVRDMHEVAKIDTWPGSGNAPTSQWAPGEILADTYRIPIGIRMPAPSLLQLLLGVWEGTPANTLPITLGPDSTTDTIVLKVGRVADSTPPHLHAGHHQRQQTGAWNRPAGVGCGRRGRNHVLLADR